MEIVSGYMKDNLPEIKILEQSQMQESPYNDF